MAYHGRNSYYDIPEVAKRANRLWNRIMLGVLLGSLLALLALSGCSLLQPKPICSAVILQMEQTKDKATFEYLESVHRKYRC